MSIALMRLRQRLLREWVMPKQHLNGAERASEGTQQTSGMYTGILPLVYCGIGVAFAKAGRITEAEEAFEQAIECRRESKGDHWARALLMVGEFYLDRGDMTRAKAHFEAAKQAFGEMEMSYFQEKTEVLLNQLSRDEADRGWGLACHRASRCRVQF